MKDIQSVLKLVADGLKSIAKCVEAISDKVDEAAESQTAEKPKSPAKPKARKSVSAATKKKAVNKTARKTPKKKAAKAPTAAETVYNVISKSTESVNTATLIKETAHGYLLPLAVEIYQQRIQRARKL